jgi:hypothetical protein
MLRLHPVRATTIVTRIDEAVESAGPRFAMRHDV